MSEQTAWDALVDRLTKRLEVDPELRREVGRELRGHLEDAEAEYRRAGMEEAAAREAAAKSLGEEGELSAQLWEANRRRVRVRSAARWAAGVTLVPGAVAASVAVTWGAVASVIVLIATVANVPVLSIWVRPAAAYFERREVARLPEAARAVVDVPLNRDEALARAKLLAEAHPGDGVYWANYVNAMLARQEVETDLKREPARRRGEVDRILAALDRGKAIEPDNAFYPLVKAGLLARLSSREIEEEDDSRLPGFEYGDGLERRVNWRAGRFEVSDRAMFERVVSELREAAGRVYLEAHEMDLMDRRLALLPAARTVGDVVWRREYAQEVSAPYYRYYRAAADAATSRALELSNARRFDEALAVARDEGRVVKLMAARARRAGDVAVAQGVEFEARGLEAEVRRESGDRAGFERAAGALGVDWNSDISLMRRGQAEVESLRDSPQVAAVDQPSTPWMRSMPAGADFAAGRRAEYAAVDRLAVSALLAGLTLFGLGVGVWAVWMRARRGRWPAMVFVGWRRVVAILGVAVLLPVVVYGVYAYVTPLAGRGAAVGWNHWRLAAEYAIVATAILVLLRWRVGRALRVRAVELGLEGWAAGTVSARRLVRGGMSVVVVGLVLAGVVWLATADYVAGWVTAMGAGLGVVSLGVSVAALARRRAGTVGGAAAADAVFSYRLSVAPVVLMAAVVLAGVAGWPLTWAERRAVAAMENAPGAYRPTHEVERSYWEAVRQRIASRAQ